MLATLLVLSWVNIISFGIDIAGALTKTIIVIIILASVPIFLLANKMDQTKNYVKVYQAICILLMVIIVYYLIDDALCHRAVH